MKKLLTIFVCMAISSFMNQSKAQTIDSTDDSEEERTSSACGGTERWAEKVLTDALVSTVNFTPVNSTVAALVALSTPAPSSSMPRTAPVETTTYTITCHITVKKAETDADYHLVLSDGTHTLIGEIPNPVCSTAATSAHQAQYLAARNFIDAHISSGNIAPVNIPMVTVTGVAFIDPPHGQTGAAPNNLELHPILNIHFATATAIEEKESRILNVDIGPNPFNVATTINVSSKINNLKTCTLLLFDLLGNEVREEPLSVIDNNKINYTLNKGDLNKGIYIYRITNDDSPLYEGKLMVE